MNVFSLTIKSICHRPLSFVLTFCSLLLSFILLMSVSHLKRSVPLSFEKAISGTDLIVGAHTGSVSLLLYAAFRIGQPAANLSYSLYEQMLEHPEVRSAIPISLGDSHRGYPVLATTQHYFDHYQYGNNQPLKLAMGSRGEFGSRLDTVILGARVAEELGYGLGQLLTISHGMDEVSFEEHENVLFEVSGILERTGTSVDRSLHITLEGLEAVHLGWNNRNPDKISVMKRADMKPKAISTLLVGLHSKTKVFRVQEEIMENPGYRAILPGVAFSELWEVMRVSERILGAVGFLVVFCTLLGMICSMLISLVLRRKEMAIIRSLGGSPLFIGAMMLMEALSLVVLALVVAWALSAGLIAAFSGVISRQWGVYLSGQSIWQIDPKLMMITFLVGLVAAMIPAVMAYRRSLFEGITSF